MIFSFSGKGGSYRYLKIFFVIMALLSIALALGKYNPLYPLIYRLPGFHSFRIPAQVLFIYVFSVSVLVGMGVHAMQEQVWHWNRMFLPVTIIVGFILMGAVVAVAIFPKELFFSLFHFFSQEPIQDHALEKITHRIISSIDKSALLFFGSLILFLLYRSGRIQKNTFNVLVLLVLMTDLFHFGEPYLQSHDYGQTGRSETITKQLSQIPPEGRVVTQGPELMPNDGMLYRFPSILGYDPLILKRYVYFIQASQDMTFDNHVVNLGWITRLDSRLLKMLNVRQAVVGGRVFEMENDIPYAIFVDHVTMGSGDEILHLMKDQSFDPRETVILEEHHGLPRNNPSKVEKSLVASWSILDYDTDSIRIKAESNKSGYMVLSEIFYPGWNATVNGNHVPVMCGNYLFRVIPLVKGYNDIHLYYRSWPFRIGLVVSLITLLCILGYLLWHYGRRG
jgi:hypothetical protein